MEERKRSSGERSCRWCVWIFAFFLFGLVVVVFFFSSRSSFLIPGCHVGLLSTNDVVSRHKLVLVLALEHRSLLPWKPPALSLSLSLSTPVDFFVHQLGVWLGFGKKTKPAAETRLGLGRLEPAGASCFIHCSRSLIGPSDMVMGFLIEAGPPMGRAPGGHSCVDNESPALVLAPPRSYLRPFVQTGKTQFHPVKPDKNPLKPNQTRSNPTCTQ